MQEPLLHLSRLVSVGFAFALHLRKSSFFAFILLLFTVPCFNFNNNNNNNNNGIYIALIHRCSVKKDITISLSTCLHTTLVLFLGETLRCKSCFSRESLKDCLETAKSRPCAKNEVLCMLHQTVTTKRGRYYFEHCATKTFYKFRRESCYNPTRAIVNDPRLGNVTCSIHCTGGDCSDENMSLVSFLRR